MQCLGEILNLPFLQDRLISLWRLQTCLETSIHRLSGRSIELMMLQTFEKISDARRDQAIPHTERLIVYFEEVVDSGIVIKQQV